MKRIVKFFLGCFTCFALIVGAVALLAEADKLSKQQDRIGAWTLGTCAVLFMLCGIGIALISAYRLDSRR